MAKMKVKLTHCCNVKGSKGIPGDTVEVDEALGKQFIAGGGAVAIEGTAKQETKPPVK